MHITTSLRLKFFNQIIAIETNDTWKQIYNFWVFNHALCIPYMWTFIEKTFTEAVTMKQYWVKLT